MQAIFTGITDVYGVPFRVAIIPASNPNRPGTTQHRKLTGGRYTTSTVHETANTARGANAEMHRAFVYGGGGTEGVSFHAVVDSYEIIQLLPLDEVAWHAGDGAYGPGNSTSIATETCVNSDGDWQRTLQNMAKWQAFLLQNGGLTVYDMVQHNHWSGKDCPHIMRLNGGTEWYDLVHTVNGLLAPAPPQEPDTYTDPATGKSIAHGFLSYWREHPYLGHPLSGEFTYRLEDGNDWVVQLFERGLLQWRMGAQVQEARIGAMWAQLADIAA